MKPNQPSSLLTTQPPGFSERQAAEVARSCFGFVVSASPLWSERDQNFRLRTDSGEQYVLKIANAQEDPGVIDLQVRALEHISAVDPGLPVPRTISTSEGTDFCLVPDADGRQHMVRLITWLDGYNRTGTYTNPELLRGAGGILARLGLALREFSHPAASHHLLWDLKNAAELLELLPHIEKRALRNRLEKALLSFVEHVHPVIGSLRTQVIHADLNCGNILISKEPPERVTGIIDFGDMVFTPLIMDLAIAATYQLLYSGDPLLMALHFIAGYQEVTPLEELESELLLDLMKARLCTSIILQMWRAKLYPENAEYLLSQNRQTRYTLEHIMARPEADLRRRIMSACRC